MNDTIKSINNWFTTAKPNPTAKDITTQIGAMCEEMSEVLDAINCDYMRDNMKQLSHIFYTMNENHSAEYLDNINHEALLDGLCDTQVTAQGVANYLGMDYMGAIEHINASNYSKFEDGKPILNEHGKIMKGKYYFKPNLQRFLPPHDEAHDEIS